MIPLSKNLFSLLFLEVKLINIFAIWVFVNNYIHICIPMLIVFHILGLNFRTNGFVEPRVSIRKIKTTQKICNVFHLYSSKEAFFAV